MQTYVITAPDGREYEVTAPEGASQEDVLNYAKQNYQSVNKPSAASPDQSTAETARLARQTPKTEPKSIMDQMFGLGSPIARVAKGAIVDPLLGVNQIVANAIPFDNPVTRGANQLVKNTNAVVDEARGDTGFDPYQLLGGVISPLNKVLPSSTATTKVGKVAEAVKLGAATAATQTVDNPEKFAEEKLTQMFLGAAIGGTLMTTGQVVKTVNNILQDLPLTEAARKRIQQKYVMELVGKNPQEVVEKLRNAPELVTGSKPTVAEALSSTPSGARLIAEQSAVSKNAPEGFLKRTQEQQQAREKLLTNTFGTEADVKKLTTERNTVTSQMRDTALEWADTYGKTAPSLMKAIDKAGKALEHGKSWFSGMLDADKVSNYTKFVDFKKAQLQSLNDNGFYPLVVTDLKKTLSDSIDNPKAQSNELLMHGASALKRKLSNPAYVDEFGFIRSDALYNIRKSIGEDLQEYAQSKGNASFSYGASEVEQQLKKLIDASINKASGSGLWSKYIDTFTDYSKKIDRMKTGQAIQDKLKVELSDKQNAGAFAKALEEFTPIAQKATGGTFYNKPEELFTDKELKALNSVYADLSRKAVTDKVRTQANKGSGLLSEAEKELPTVFDQRVAVLKSVIATLRRGSQKEFNAKLSELFLDPKAMADFISAVPAAKAEGVISAMMKKASPEVQDIMRKALITTPVLAAEQSKGN